MMNYVMISFLFASSFILISCSNTSKANLSNAQIISMCLDKKKKAISPEAEVNLSKSKKGNSVGFSLSFSSDFIRGSDPEVVYSDCIKQLAS